MQESTKVQEANALQALLLGNSCFRNILFLAVQWPIHMRFRRGSGWSVAMLATLRNSSATLLRMF